MREVFAETDTRLPPLERARLGANGTVFASPEVRELYERLFAESWPVEVYPGRFRTDEARLEVLGRTAGILGELGGCDRPRTRRWPYPRPNPRLPMPPRSRGRCPPGRRCTCTSRA
jgi:hypothetical protein